MKEELENKAITNMTLKIKGGAIPRITLSRRSTVSLAIRVLVLIGCLCCFYSISWADGIHTGNYALIGWNDLSGKMKLVGDLEGTGE